MSMKNNLAFFPQRPYDFLLFRKYSTILLSLQILLTPLRNTS